MKNIFVINGHNGVGKDTFVELFSKYIPSIQYSSVEKVKEIAKMAGWDGISKTEEDRKFLSTLKFITAQYNDLPFKSMREEVIKFRLDNEHECLFLHIREPKEIDRAVKEFKAKTILIIRKSVKQVTSNVSDANVMNYRYDFEINNDGTLEDFDKVAKIFAKVVRKGV